MSTNIKITPTQKFSATA